VLPGVNFVPSLLSPSGPTLTVAGVVALILAGIFWRRLGRLGRPLATTAGLALLAGDYASGAYGAPRPGWHTLALFGVAGLLS